MGKTPAGLVLILEPQLGGLGDLCRGFPSEPMRRLSVPHQVVSGSYERADCAEALRIAITRIDLGAGSVYRFAAAQPPAPVSED